MQKLRFCRAPGVASLSQIQTEVSFLLPVCVAALSGCAEKRHLRYAQVARPVRTRGAAMLLMRMGDALLSVSAASALRHFIRC